MWLEAKLVELEIIGTQRPYEVRLHFNFGSQYLNIIFRYPLVQSFYRPLPPTTDCHDC